ncbi:MAG: hypothetical protein OEZ68_18240, partial [Gammaproteobacteria bacterium]|nr:hypothetical protein [Gammaproteobacteria bacterium]
MSESIIAIVNRIHDKYLHDIPSKDATRGDRFKASMRKLLQFLLMRKKLVLLALLLLTICFFVLLFLMEDYLTKRQAYPIRHVLFQCNETVQFSRGKIGRQDRFWDRDARTIIQKGNSDGTKLGDILGIQKLETTDEGGQYQLEDKDKTRIAYAVTKLEPVQAGISFTGTLDFRETYAEILGENDRFINYRIIPERGAHNLEVNVIADAEGNKKLVNKLITYRSKPLGVLWGTRFRSATSLDEFLDTPKNQSKERHFFELVDQYHGQAKLSGEQRLKLVQELAQTINSMETQSIYISHEDGIVDYVAQESSTFLFNRPSVVQQFTTPLYSDDGTKPSPGNSGKQGDFAINNTNQELVHIRVERLIDLFPGNYFLLNNLIIGDAPNIVRPFSHTNNGGYEIVDGQGVVAKIEIEDFFLHYGDDLLYKYYLDKDGNGIIDSDKELIGQVLYR